MIVGRAHSECCSQPMILVLGCHVEAL